jgi:hypothetical protein
MQNDNAKCKIGWRDMKAKSAIRGLQVISAILIFNV